uniref:CCHC-type domain-containing protein n=1 Tax=Ascaris lumbricoides TaxID=6252 RepID=A0A0M3IE62_ASCLU
MLHAELSPFHVTGAAEDLGGPSEELSRQQQRKDATSGIVKRKRAQYEETAKDGNDVAAHIRYTDMLRAELSPFHVTGAAEDLGRPSEELSRQQQRKGNAISALDATSDIVKRKTAQYEETAKDGNDVAAHIRREYSDGNPDERGGPINGGWRLTQLVHAGERPGLEVWTCDCQPRLDKRNRRSELAHKQANSRTSQWTQCASKTSDSGNSAGRVANGKGRNEQSLSVCYVCKGRVHTARVCPSATVRRASVAEAARPEPKADANDAIELRVTSIEAASQQDDAVGNKLAVELLGDGVPLTALSYSAAMVSLISVTALRKIAAALSEKIEKGDE